MQERSYRDNVLPPGVSVRVAIEAASTAYWYQFVGLEGAVIGLDQFGVSAPAAQAYEYFGITVSEIVNITNKIIKNNS